MLFNYKKKQTTVLIYATIGMNLLDIILTLFFNWCIVDIQYLISGVPYSDSTFYTLWIDQHKSSYHPSPHKVITILTLFHVLCVPSEWLVYFYNWWFNLLHLFDPTSTSPPLWQPPEYPYLWLCAGFALSCRLHMCVKSHGISLYLIYLT